MVCLFSPLAENFFSEKSVAFLLFGLRFFAVI